MCLYNVNNFAIFDMLREWDGEQDWSRGKASPAHESASLMFLVQSIISPGRAAEVESIMICWAQMHKAVVTDLEVKV